MNVKVLWILFHTSWVDYSACFWSHRFCSSACG